MNKLIILFILLSTLMAKAQDTLQVNFLTQVNENTLRVTKGYIIADTIMVIDSNDPEYYHIGPNTAMFQVNTNLYAKVIGKVQFISKWKKQPIIDELISISLNQNNCYLCESDHKK